MPILASSDECINNYNVSLFSSLKNTALARGRYMNTKQNNFVSVLLTISDIIC